MSYHTLRVRYINIYRLYYTTVNYVNEDHSWESMALLKDVLLSGFKMHQKFTLWTNRVVSSDSSRGERETVLNDIEKKVYIACCSLPRAGVSSDVLCCVILYCFFTYSSESEETQLYVRLPSRRRRPRSSW